MKLGQRFIVSAMLALEHNLHADDCTVEFVRFDAHTRLPLFRAIRSGKLIKVDNPAMLVEVAVSARVTAMPILDDATRKLLGQLHASDTLLESLAELAYQDRTDDTYTPWLYLDVNEKQKYVHVAYEQLQCIAQQHYILVSVRDVVQDKPMVDRLASRPIVDTIYNMALQLPVPPSRKR